MACPSPLRNFHKAIMDRPTEKKTRRKAKIIQVFTNKDGVLTGVLYDDGRVFFWNWKKYPNQFDENPRGEGYWGELMYPNL